MMVRDCWLTREKKNFVPLLASITSDMTETARAEPKSEPHNTAVHSVNHNIYYLLGGVGALTGKRADRGIQRAILKPS
jgi:hypothetical protein